MAGRRGNNEGSIRKRKDGRWEARVTVNGKQRSFYGASREEVARRLRRELKRADDGMPQIDRRQTVGDFLDRWLRDSVSQRVRPRTYDSYATHVELHLKPDLGRIQLARLQPAHVQWLLNRKLEAGLSVATVQRIRSTLRAALNQAMRWGDVSRNVARLVELPSENRPEIEPLSPEQARRFLDHIEGHKWQALFVVALATGLRQGELLALRWSDVDLDERLLTVRYSLQRIRGERQLVEPKTNQSRRSVSLAETAVSALRRQELQQCRDRQLAGERWVDEDFVFTTSIGTPIDGAEATRTFQALLGEADLPRKRFHDLRHSCATFLLAEGVSHREIMAILGHSGIAVTMNTYAHVLPESQREAARKMDSVLRGPETRNKGQN